MNVGRMGAVAALTALATVTGACSSSSTAAPPTTGPSAGRDVTAAGISPARCAQNKKAGTITYLSSFDFAASPSIVDVVVAKKNGYFDEMCLTVTLKSSFSTTNYPLVASNQAQFSSAGAYTEMLNYSKNGAKLVALVDYGKSNINALLVRDDGKITSLASLRDKTIGVKGALPPSIVAQLSKAGLDTHDYKTVSLDGFDPVAQLKLPIDALPVYKSNEPNLLDKAGVKYRMFDPSSEGIPGTFDLLYTNQQFLNDHPSAAQDFIRAALKGMETALADPKAAVADSLELIRAGGNKNFLTDEGETYRFGVESKLVVDAKGSLPIGVIDPKLFADEVASYTAAGSFTAPPTLDRTYVVDVAKDVYGPDGKVIWPT